MAKLNKSQKEQLRQLAKSMGTCATTSDKLFEKTFQCTKQQALLNQATLLKRFAETN